MNQRYRRHTIWSTHIVCSRKDDGPVISYYKCSRPSKRELAQRYSNGRMPGPNKNVCLKEVSAQWRCLLWEISLYLKFSSKYIPLCQKVPFQTLNLSIFHNFLDLVETPKMQSRLVGDKYGHKYYHLRSKLFYLKIIFINLCMWKWK